MFGGTGPWSLAILPPSRYRGHSRFGGQHQLRGLSDLLPSWRTRSVSPKQLSNLGDKLRVFNNGGIIALRGFATLLIVLKKDASSRSMLWVFPKLYSVTGGMDLPLVAA